MGYINIEIEDQFKFKIKKLLMEHNIKLLQEGYLLLLKAGYVVYKQKLMEENNND